MQDNDIKYEFYMTKDEFDVLINGLCIVIRDYTKEMLDNENSEYKYVYYYKLLNSYKRIYNQLLGGK